MKKSLIILAALCAVAAANAELICDFEAYGQNWGTGITVVAPASTAAHVSSAALSAVGVTGNTASNSWNTKGWDGNNGSKYFYINVVTDGQFGYTLDGFQGAFKNSSTGPKTLDVVAYIDGAVSPVMLMDDFNLGDDSYDNVIWDFTSLNLSFEDSLEIRFIGYGATSSTGTLRMADFYPGYVNNQITGTQIPEPATLALLSLGGLFFFRRK